MFLVPFFDLQNFILLVRTVQFLRNIIFISSYTAKNNYFLLYELIQDLPYIDSIDQCQTDWIQIKPDISGLIKLLVLKSSNLQTVFFFASRFILRP